MSTAVSSAELDAMRTWLRESGYRHVYRHRRAWVAKVKVDRRTVRLGRADTPREAAKLVVLWFRARHGPGWGGVERQRHRRPWRVVRCAGLGGLYRLDVWEMGRPVAVAPKGSSGFYSKREAMDYLRRHLRARYGLFAGVSCWRS